MIKKRTIFKLFCALLLPITIGCGENIVTPPDCGDPATISATPEIPTLGGFPSLTDKTKITLFGTKSTNTSITINKAGVVNAVVDFDCLTTWAADASLSDGTNDIEILSLNRTSVESSSTNISIALDTAPPNTPDITSITSCNPVMSPCTLSGSKQPGEAVFINNRLVVEVSAATAWSYDVTLTKTAPDINSFDVQLQDASGNKSTATSVTVNFTGTPIALPNLIFPLGNTGVVSQRPQFRWGPFIFGATYQIQVSTSISFNPPLAIDATVTSATTYTPPSSMLPGRYYWRVGRVDASNNNVFFSPPRKIVIGRALCDLNDDGFDDIVVGAYENDTSGPNAGKVYIYFGNSSFNSATAQRVVLRGESPEDRFGISVACAGDVNRDGVSDLIVGAYLNDSAGENAGRAYIFYGGSALTSKSASDANMILPGQAAGDQFGLSVSTAGDVNGDGFDDVIVGAYQNDGGGTNAGRAYIYYGELNMDSLPDVVLTGQTDDDQLGIRVAWAGDVNGDSFDDVVVGADRSDVGNLIDTGRAYIFLGAPNMAGRNASDADVILEGEGDDDAFASVAGAADFNNDGYSDIVVGASAHKNPSDENCFDGIDNDGDGLIDSADPDCQPVGRAYLFLGGPGLTSKSASAANLILTGETAGDAFGFAVSTAGDINDDGYADLLVGAFGKDGSASDGTAVLDVGKAYLHYGGNPFTAVAGPTITGQAAVVCSDPNLSISICPQEKKVPLSGQFGFSLASAGDVNSDGNQDIVVGSYLWDEGVVEVDPTTGQIRFGGTDKGRVYVFLGPPATSTFRSTAEDQPPSLILTGEAASDGFGISVR